MVRRRKWEHFTTDEKLDALRADLDAALALIEMQKRAQKAEVDRVDANIAELLNMLKRMGLQVFELGAKAGLSWARSR